MDQRIGQYVLRHALGQSAFSAVYRGEHIHTRAQVAIKLLHGPLTEDEINEFLTRTAELYKLQHPHIVAIQDFGIEQGIAYLVMEFVDGGTLRDRYPRGRRVPLTLLPGYVNQLTSALTYLHELGMVHRDIKPQNVLISDAGTILLSDFGTAIGSYTLSPGQASLQDFEGTVLYAAPEQLQGRPRRASDQYALAVMLYEWISGSLPFSGTFHEVVHQHLFITPPSLGEKGITCPSNIEVVLLRALEKHPRKRFPTVKLFAEEFEWACKVAQARGLFTPFTPIPPTPEDISTEKQEAQIPIALPSTPSPVQSKSQAVKRQFKLPFKS